MKSGKIKGTASNLEASMHAAGSLYHKKTQAVSHGSGCVFKVHDTLMLKGLV